MRTSAFALMAGMVLAGFAASPAFADPCVNILPPKAASVAGRPVAPRDLIELRDIGPNMIDDPTAKMFSISPDGRSIAFQMQQAEVDANTYCMSLIVKSLAPWSPPQVLDAGGQFIKRTFLSEGFALGGIPGGIGLETQPLWSPDGRQIAYLRRDAGVTQVWLADLAGAAPRPLTHELVSVDSFAWARDGKAIIIAARPGLATFQADLDREGRQGFLYDDRWIPASADRPLPREPIATAYSTVSAATGASSPATPDQIAFLTGAPDSRRPADAIVFASGPDDGVAWTSPIGEKMVRQKSALTIRRNGKVSACSETVCSGIISLWWAPDHTLLYLRSEGVPTGLMDVYRWREGATAPELVLSTRSYLTGCQLEQSLLYCREEGSLQPGRLISIGIGDGHIEPVYDPNPEFATLKLGSVERIAWTNNVGIETWGDLVLPADRKAGERLPLILVQYTSNGFLRGGTGDEFPIQVLAAHGFAVLSIQRPMHLGIARGARTFDEVNRIDMTDWADRRSVLSSYETVVHQLDARGLIDPKRVGITGLSDGASSAQFVVVNSNMFQAAAMAQCCEEDSSPSLLAGPVFSAWHQMMGYPKLTDDGKAFWEPMSIRANAARLNTPILLQISDNEYLGALEGVVALKELRKPVELYVFPDDNHVKWQPAHRFAAYTRYVDWFDFWLRNAEDPDPAKAAQYQRWEKLRAGN